MGTSGRSGAGHMGIVLNPRVVVGDSAVTKWRVVFWVGLTLGLALYIWTLWGASHG
jgi:hypothetical protein